jgi:hypothetical protein
MKKPFILIILLVLMPLQMPGTADPDWRLVRSYNPFSEHPVGASDCCITFATGGSVCTGLGYADCEATATTCNAAAKYRCTANPDEILNTACFLYPACDNKSCPIRLEEWCKAYISHVSTPPERAGLMGQDMSRSSWKKVGGLQVSIVPHSTPTQAAFVQLSRTSGSFLYPSMRRN